MFCLEFLAAIMAAGLVTSTSFLCFSSSYKQDFHIGSAFSQIAFWKSDFTNSLSSRGLTAPARLRRCRLVRAAQSSTQSENVADENLEITKQRLRELSVYIFFSSAVAAGRDHNPANVCLQLNKLHLKRICLSRL